MNFLLCSACFAKREANPCFTNCFYQALLNSLIAFIAQAAWLRCFNSAAFASLKKLPSDFSNRAFGATEPKKAPYETTGNSDYKIAILRLFMFEVILLNIK